MPAAAAASAFSGVGDVASVLSTAQRWLTAFAILLPRPMLLLALNPIFTRVELSTLLRGAVAAALLFPMWPVVAAHLDVQALGPFQLLLLILKEAALGAALGLPLGLPFWGLLAAGDIIDQQRGATQGRLNDPSGFGNLSVTGTLLLLTGIAIFVASGGLDRMAGTLYDSWIIWRPLEMLPLPGSRAPVLALSLLDQLEHQAFDLAMPVILAMALSDVTMLVVARIAPQLRIDDLSLATRNLAFFLFLPLYAAFLLFYARQDLAGADGAMRLLEPVLAGPRGPMP